MTLLEMSAPRVPDTGDLSWLQREETDGVAVPGLEAIAAEWRGYTSMTSRGWVPTLKEAGLSLLPSFDQR